MKYLTIGLILALFLLATFIKCNTDRNPLSSNDGNIVLNPSFEENEQPSLKYWYVDDTYKPVFDNDVPPGGGRWSIYLPADWYAPLPESPSYLLPLSSGRHILTVSLWGKYQTIQGSAYLIQKSNGQKNVVGRIEITDTVWTHYSLIDTVQLNPDDSLFILLHGGGTEVVAGKTHFDLVEVQLLDEN